jgi:4-hydroxyphenylacetate decarboxylase large subunit
VKRVIEGVQTWIENYALEAQRLSAVTQDKNQSKEYDEMADRLFYIALRIISQELLSKRCN